MIKKQEFKCRGFAFKAILRTKTNAILSPEHQSNPSLLQGTANFPHKLSMRFVSTVENMERESCSLYPGDGSSSISNSQICVTGPFVG